MEDDKSTQTPQKPPPKPESVARSERRRRQILRERAANEPTQKPPPKPESVARMERLRRQKLRERAADESTLKPPPKPKSLARLECRPSVASSSSSKATSEDTSLPPRAVMVRSSSTHCDDDITFDGDDDGVIASMDDDFHSSRALVYEAKGDQARSDIASERENSQKFKQSVFAKAMAHRKEIQEKRLKQDQESDKLFTEMFKSMLDGETEASNKAVDTIASSQARHEGKSDEHHAMAHSARKRACKSALFPVEEDGYYDGEDYNNGETYDDGYYGEEYYDGETYDNGEEGYDEFEETSQDHAAYGNRNGKSNANNTDDYSVYSIDKASLGSTHSELDFGGQGRSNTKKTPCKSGSASASVDGSKTKKTTRTPKSSKGSVNSTPSRPPSARIREKKEAEEREERERAERAEHLQYGGIFD